MPGNPALVDITQAHIDGVRPLLEGTGYPLYVAEVTGGDATREYPYLVLWPVPIYATAGDLAGTPTEATFRWQVTAVGRDLRETGAARDRAMAELVGIRPAVANRDCGLISMEPGDQPIRPDPTARDPNTRRPVFYAVANYSLFTTAA